LYIMELETRYLSDPFVGAGDWDFEFPNSKILK